MRFTSAIVLAVCIGASGRAAAQGSVPERVHFDARLTDNAGNPLAGDHAVSFALFDVASAGAALWTEAHPAVAFSAAGLASVELGATAPLTATLLDGRALFLELTVDGTVMSPRLAIASVPYALRATVAAAADRVGTLAPTDLQRRVTGACGAGFAVRSANADGTVVCEPVGFSTEAQLTSLLDDNYRAASWVPSWSEVTAKPAGLVAGPLMCVAGSKVSGVTAQGQLVCAADDTVDQATVEGWARNACYDTEAELTAVLDADYAPLGHTHAWSSLTGIPASFADGVDNDTTYSAGAGLQLAGTTFSASGITSAMVTDGTLTGADISSATTLNVARVTYSTPRAKRLVVGETQFRSRAVNGVVTFGYANGGAYMANSGISDVLVAPLQVPVGATVTQLTVVYVDNEATLDLQFTVLANSLGSGYVLVASVSNSSGAAAGPRSQVIDVAPDRPVFADEELQIRVGVVNGPSQAAWPNTGTMIIAGVVVDYTISEAP